MSLNVSGSKYIRVYDPSIKLNYSEKVVFVNLVTSRKTGNSKVDKETGEILIDPDTQEELPERAFSHWKGRFVGNAFEASKGLRDGDSIDILNGWIVNEKFIGKDGKEHFNTYITITDFELSEIAEGKEE